MKRQSSWKSASARLGPGASPEAVVKVRSVPRVDLAVYRHGNNFGPVEQILTCGTSPGSDAQEQET